MLSVLNHAQCQNLPSPDFKGMTLKEMVEAVSTRDVRPEIPTSCSDSLREVIARCVRKRDGSGGGQVEVCLCVCACDWCVFCRRRSMEGEK